MNIEEFKQPESATDSELNENLENDLDQDNISQDKENIDRLSSHVPSSHDSFRTSGQPIYPGQEYDGANESANEDDS